MCTTDSATPVADLATEVSFCKDDLEAEEGARDLQEMSQEFHQSADEKVST